MTDLEFSPSVIRKDPQESGGASVWPLKYWTTASPVLLLTVVTWNVRPCFLLTYLLLESKLSERRVWPILLLVKFLIPRYDDSAVQCGSEVELETSLLQVASLLKWNVLNTFKQSFHMQPHVHSGSQDEYFLHLWFRHVTDNFNFQSFFLRIL